MKKLVQVALATVLVVPTVLAGSLSVEAATAAQMNSTSDITFSQDTTVTQPINPLVPSQNVTANPNDTHAPGTAGPLSIDYVSNFHFGTQKIQALNATYYANLDQVEDSTTALISVPNYVQVTDKRGLNTGWKLSVKQGSQFSTGGATPSVLTGAVLSFVSPTANSTASPTLAPIGTPVILDPTGAATSVVATGAALTGMGTWAMSFGNNNTTGAQGIKLTVPMTTTKVTGTAYSTTLTWSLADSPL